MTYAACLGVGSSGPRQIIFLATVIYYMKSHSTCLGMILVRITIFLLCLKGFPNQMTSLSTDSYCHGAHICKTTKKLIN